MTPAQISNLIQSAESVRGHFKPSKDVDAGGVAAAILTANGNIYTGICIETACSMGFCAEHAALAEMLKNRETYIVGAIALCGPNRVIPPCGRCREMFKQIDPRNLDADLAISMGEFKKLKELLPYAY